MGIVVVVVACAVALAVSIGVLVWGSRLAGARRPSVSGLAALLGSAAGATTLWLLGGATNLTVIVLLPALLLALIETVLSARSVHWVWRLVVQGLVILGALVFEWRRGDLFATEAAMAAVIGVVGFNVVCFGVRAAQLSGTPRTPPALGLLGAGYLLVIAQGLPNPGLWTLILLAVAATAPLVIWRGPTGIVDHALGPVLAGLACALGYYAWLGNASPAMVVAPLLVVALDIAWTLAARLLTRTGRARLAAAGSWWRRIDAFVTPADDLVLQRLARTFSLPVALGVLFGASVLAVAFGLGEWLVALPWLYALAGLLLFGGVVVLGSWVVARLRRPARPTPAA